MTLVHEDTSCTLSTKRCHECSCAGRSCLIIRTVITSVARLYMTLFRHPKNRYTYTPEGLPPEVSHVSTCSSTTIYSVFERYMLQL